MSQTAKKYHCEPEPEVYLPLRLHLHVSPVGKEYLFCLYMADKKKKSTPNLDLFKSLKS